MRFIFSAISPTLLTHSPLSPPPTTTTPPPPPPPPPPPLLLFLSQFSSFVRNETEGKKGIGWEDK